MSNPFEQTVLDSIQRTAARVPAYRTLLKEAGVEIASISSLADCQRLPVLEKRTTFQRFDIAELCLDGELGRLGSVLTSSGHSGIFAFGLNSEEAQAATAAWIDDGLDAMFAVRTRPTLLINCLPMGVKVSTRACTLAETSVRADMAVGLVRAFGPHFSQLIFVGETAFIKHILELGIEGGVDWKRHQVNVIVGEEPLAENGRKYLETLLGADVHRPGSGLVFSSMGVAELGLNLFFEVPPRTALIALRRLLHDHTELRRAIFGAVTIVPSLFTYDPRRIFVEFDESGRLILTTLDPLVRLPLVRYATGDRGAFLQIPAAFKAEIESAGIDWELIHAFPIVAMQGRGEHASAGKRAVYPEEVKEGIYFDHDLVPQTTANFRLVSGLDAVRVRIQLSPGTKPDPKLDERFATAIERYVSAPITVTCESYETFGSGMALDYERKFAYLGR